MAVEEVRRLLQSRAGADGAVHERRLPREKKIVVLLRDSHIFQDESIGMVGFLGSASLPVSGSLMDSPYKYGAVYVPTEEDFSEMRFGMAVQAAADVRYDVRYILPSFFATQWDIPWDESYEKQYYAVLAYCRAFEEEEDRIVVPLPENIWCAYQVRNISFDASEAGQKKFFTRYHTYLDGTESKESGTLYACGEGSTIPSWQEFSFPEGISVGKETHIRKTALCRLVRPNFAGKPRIIVGDYCEIGIGSTLAAVNCIELENAVSVAENVHIKDYVLDESGVGISTVDRELLAEKGGIHVERGVRIEENVLIRGAVRIGRGSIVRVGSRVQQDIPPYCIAEGSPAHIVKAFSPRAGKWLPVTGDKALRRLLSERESAAPADIRFLQEVVDVPAAQLSQEKKWVMDRLIIPRCRKVKEEQRNLSLDRLLDVVRDYYGEEPYYEEICKSLEDVLKERQS